MSRAYRISLFCGLVPLVTGIGIFLTWLLTRSKWLLYAGWWTMVCAPVFLLVGAIALLTFRSGKTMANEREIIRKARVWEVLFVLNFVAALFVVFVVDRILATE
jgi:hypothetical protein